MLKCVVVFTMVFIFGVMAAFTFAQETESSAESLSEDAPQKKEGQKKVKLDELTRDLNLTEEQQAQVREIFAKAEILIDDIMAQSKSNAEINRVKSMRREEIKAILTEEQKVIFEEQELIKWGPIKKNDSVPEISGAEE